MRRAGVLGVVVGVVLAAALVAAGVLEVPEGRTGDAAAEELVEAWRRHRYGTFVVESDWRRTMTGSGETMISATRLAQRPPDRVLRQFGAVRGQIGGAPVRCSTDPSGEYRCFASGARAPDYDVDVDAELEALRSAVLGEHAIYRTTADGDGCFRLEQTEPYPDPPYGHHATMCFDRRTGAMRYLRRELERAVEEQEAVSIRADVRDRDFDLAVDPDYEPVVPGTGGELDDPVATDPTPLDDVGAGDGEEGTGADDGSSTTGAPTTGGTAPADSP